MKPKHNKAPIPKRPVGFFAEKSDPMIALANRAHEVKSPWRDFKTDPPPSSVKRRQIPILAYRQSGNTWCHPEFDVGIIHWSGPRRGWEWSSGWIVKKLPTHWAELTIPQNGPPSPMPRP